MVLVAKIVAIVWLSVVNVVVYLLNENSVIKFCLGGRKYTANYSTNRAAGLTQASVTKDFFSFDQHDANHLVTSFLGRAGPSVLLVWRIFALCYFAAGLLLIEFQGLGLDGEFMPYFTNWTFVSLGVYALLGISLSIRHLIRSRNTVYGETSEARAYDLLDKLFVISLTLGSACGAFLTLFYWATIYDGTAIRVDNVMRHGGNVLVYVGEYILSRTPVVGYHFQFAIGYASIYAVFLWFWAETQDEWLYTALDYSVSKNTVTYLLLAPLVLLGFLFMYCVAGFREFLGRGQCCCMCCPCCRGCSPACIEVEELRQFHDSMAAPATVAIPMRSAP